MARCSLNALRCYWTCRLYYQAISSSLYRELQSRYIHCTCVNLNSLTVADYIINGHFFLYYVAGPLSSPPISRATNHCTPQYSPQSKGRGGHWTLRKCKWAVCFLSSYSQDTVHDAVMYTVHVEVARFELVPKDIKVPPPYSTAISAQ